MPGSRPLLKHAAKELCYAELLAARNLDPPRTYAPFSRDSSFIGMTSDVHAALTSPTAWRRQPGGNGQETDRKDDRWRGLHLHIIPATGSGRADRGQRGMRYVRSRRATCVVGIIPSKKCASKVPHCTVDRLTRRRPGFLPNPGPPHRSRAINWGGEATGQTVSLNVIVWGGRHGTPWQPN